VRYIARPSERRGASTGSDDDMVWSVVGKVIVSVTFPCVPKWWGIPTGRVPNPGIARGQKVKEGFQRPKGIGLAVGGAQVESGWLDQGLD